MLHGTGFTEEGVPVQEKSPIKYRFLTSCVATFPGGGAELDPP